MSTILKLHQMCQKVEATEGIARNAIAIVNGNNPESTNLNISL